MDFMLRIWISAGPNSFFKHRSYSGQPVKCLWCSLSSDELDTVVSMFDFIYNKHGIQKGAEKHNKILNTKQIKYPEMHYRRARHEAN